MEYSKEELILLRDVMKGKVQPCTILGLDGLTRVLDVCDEYLEYGTREMTLHHTLGERAKQLAVLDNYFNYLSDKNICFVMCALRLCTSRGLSLTLTKKGKIFAHDRSAVLRYISNMDIDNLPDIVTIEVV